jgi:serine protease AprX
VLGRGLIAACSLAVAVTGLLAPARSGEDGRASDGRADASLSVTARSAAAIDDELLLPSAGDRPVILRAAPGRVAEAISAVRAAGGHVGRPLPLIDGFSATMSPSAVRAAAADPAVRAVVADRTVHLAAESFSAARAKSTFPSSSGAVTAWSRGVLGDGVGVALIDTGVARVADLAGRVDAGPDFSAEGDSRLDSFGHGTVMAGVIAGDGAISAATMDDGSYAGMAPQARIVSVKVAGRNGVTDVSTVLAAMQWVVAFREAYDIRVVNLSWGTPSTQSPSVDPLDYAVERLWRAGIVVVTAAGNAGPDDATITKPADDPVVVSVGAYDDKQNTDPADDALALWSSRGRTADGVVKPDLVAPGRRLVAVRSRGSYIDQANPSARVGTAYIRGSGTSHAAAVVSGAAALLLEARPDLRPDEVKYALRASALPLEAVAATGQGAGRVAVGRALEADVYAAPVQEPAGTGLGSLEASRGGHHVRTVCPGATTATTIVGEQDVRCRPWTAAAWVADSWSADSWSADSWSADSWSADSWSADSWSSYGFMSAYWGQRTKPGRRLPGEVAEQASPGGAGKAGVR